MVISYKHKFVFIHIPKAAGSSVTNALMIACGFDPAKVKDINPTELSIYKVDAVAEYRNAGDLHQHANYPKIKEYLLDKNLDIKDFFVFSFIRNPWEWYVSTYYFNRKICTGLVQSNRPQPEWAKECWDYSFEDWLTKIIVPKQYHQSMYLQYKNTYPIDFIGNSNDMQNSFDNLCDKLNLKRTKVAYINTNQHNHYSSYYSEKTSNMVKEIAHREIELFGYEYIKV